MGGVCEGQEGEGKEGLEYHGILPSSPNQRRRERGVREGKEKEKREGKERELFSKCSAFIAYFRTYVQMCAV